MDENCLLDFKNVSKVYSAGILGRKTIKAVENVSFSLPRERHIITCLAGESGSGKTTIANIALGLLQPTSGEVLYNGKNVYTMSRKERFNYRREVQAVFQDPYGAYNPFYKVNRILELPVRKFGLASSKNETNKMVSESLMNVGLRPEEVLEKYPHELSGGQRQRVMLARVVLLKPKLIIADEPVSMLDVSLRAEILDIFLKLKDEYGISFLYITHDLSVAYYLSDNILILHRGRVVEKGPTTFVIDAPCHPYSQLLINSVPIPNPEKRWTEKMEVDTDSFSLFTTSNSGCLFQGRCLQSIELCKENRPDLVEIEKDHYVACHQIHSREQ